MNREPKPLRKNPKTYGVKDDGFNKMISRPNAHVNDCIGNISLRWKSSQFVAPQVFSLNDALEHSFASPEFHLGTQWWSAKPGEITNATPFRYWCVIDFDSKVDPSKSLHECFDFIVTVLKPLGLKQGTHFNIAVSGTKGCKVFFRHMPPVQLDAPKIWHAFLLNISKTYSTCDAQVAFQTTLRGPWSRHPKNSKRWQSVIQKGAGALSHATEWCLKQAEENQRPAFDEFRSVLPTLEDAPPSFLALWAMAQEIFLKVQLESLPKRKRPTYSLRGTNVGGILDANGISYREGSGMSGDRYFRLTRCIFCGAKSKAAIKEKSLYYDCFRQTCQAASGLNFREWTASLDVPVRFAGKARGVYNRTLALRARKPVAPMPLVKARNALFSSISKAFDSQDGETFLIACTPGLGKTHSTLAVIADRLSENPKLKVVIGCQTRELANELLIRSQAFDFPLLTKRVLLEGRNDENCSFPRQVATIGQLGWSPGKAFCAGCPYHGTCGYYRTVKDASDKRSIVFTTHEQAIAFIDSDQIKPSKVVFDEDPFRAIHHDFKVGVRDIRKAGNLDFEDVVEAAHFLVLSMGRASHQMPENGKIRFAGESLRELLDDAFEKSGCQIATDWRSLLLKASAYVDVVEPAGGVLAGASSATIRSVTPRSVFQLMEELVREHDDGFSANSTTRLIVRSDGLVFWELQRRQRPASFLPDLILDAYGDPTLYERLLGVPITDVTVSSDLSKTKWFYVPVNSSRSSLSDVHSVAWKEMDLVMAELSKAGEVLVGTYLAYAEDVENRYGCKTFHFGRGRGIDSFKDCQSVVLFGVPQPPTTAIIDRASFYFQDDESPLSDEIDEKNRRTFTDFRVQKALDSMRESEAAQVVHRVRPAIAPRTVVTIGMIDYPVLPVPKPFPRTKDDAHLESMESWVRDWFTKEGWFTPALIGENVCPIPAIPPRKAAKLWKKIFGVKGQSLSPHPTLCARRVWGDRDKAREWVRQVAKAQGIEYWEEL